MIFMEFAFSGESLLLFVVANYYIHGFKSDLSREVYGREVFESGNSAKHISGNRIP